LHGQDTDDVRNEPVERKRDALKLEPARLDLREVEHVLDRAE
jgi:hypothetical protein